MHPLHRVQHVVVVVPVDPDVDEAQHVAEEHRQQRRSAASAASCGTFSSSTMMVMMIASTPSLNASSRVLPMVGGDSTARAPRAPAAAARTHARYSVRKKR